MSKRLEHALAGLALILALVAIYSDKLFGPGYIFTEVIQDITNIYGFFPWDSFSAKQLERGYFPLWNPHNGLGVPHLANMQSAVFYPLNWVKFIFGFWNVIDWLLIARLWLAGFFLYLFARTALRLSLSAAFFSGISYALCGYFLRYVYMSHLNIECLIPLQLWLFFKLGRDRKLSSWIFSGLGIYLLIAGGFPEASLYAVCFSTVYFLFGTRAAPGFKTRAALLSSALAFGIMLSSAQWLVFYEYLGQAWSYHQESAGLRHFNIAHAVSLLLPWFFGKNLESTLINFLAPGLGTVAVIFCIRAVLGLRSAGAGTGFWLVSLAVLLGVIFGLPVFGELGKIFPFSLTYNDKYAMPCLSLCVSALAGIGFEKFINDDRLSLDLAAIGAAWVWASANLVGALLNGFQPYYGFGIKFEMTRLFLIAAALLLVLTFRGRKALRGPAALLILCLTMGSSYFDYQCNRGIELKEYLFGQLKEAGRLKNYFPQPYRYSAADDILFPNLLLALEADDLRSYDPLYPKSYVYLMAAANGLATDDEINRHYNEHKLFQIDRGRLDSSLAPLMNLTLYSADYELNSIPVADTMIKQGKEMGEFAGWARKELVDISGQSKKSLLMHASGKLEAELETEEQPSEIIFDAGLAPYKGDYQGDGAQFQLFLWVQGKPVLSYSRFLNPALREEERFWKPARLRMISTGKKVKLALLGLSGPRGETPGDYLAWGGLRFLSIRNQIEGAQNLTEKGEISLNHLLKSYPRYFLARSAGEMTGKNLKDEFEKFRLLRTVQVGYFRYQAVLPQAMKFETTGKRLSGESQVKSVAGNPEKVELDVRAANDCFLLCSDQYFPGWRASVDSREARVLRADLALRAVYIPAGEHQIKFWYQPRSFEIGLWATLSGFFGVIALFARGAFRKLFGAS